jgi:23S rRNA (adenine2503-C2)-methyltransferase
MIPIIPITTENSPTPEPRTGERADVLGLSRERLAEVLAPVVDRPFRVQQIYRALYERAARDFSEMTELSKDLRVQLAERFRVGLPEISSRHISEDGTGKYLFRLIDGATIEAVDIPDRGRHTFCISSQAGCALACSFCVTGYWGAGRNLTAGEIVGQVLAIRADRRLPMEGLNIVFMGMGEPLLNLENVKAALDILTEWISPHRITVSTVGILPGLEEMAGWERRPNLAVSLHAANEELRGRIMPVNRTYPLAELMAALRRYPLEKGRKLTFEYILIRDVNDSNRDADQLSRLLSGLKAKVNLIPVNPDSVLGDRMVPPSAERIEAFKERLRDRGWIATVRRRRGDDVSAACGQLRAFGREARGFRGNAKPEGVS